MSVDWDSVYDSEVGGRMDWSPYASGSCYCLISHGNPESQASRNQRYMKDEVVAGRAAWDDAMMKAFCEYWSPSTNSLLTGVGELSLSLWDFYKLGEPHGYIRASMFKMASCMTTGTVVSLAIPVLASIYKGMSVVASSASPSASSCCCPA
ncbi:hypothetical protein LIER_17212 [Lithospermum erythrorhizon]|uniref:Uncharacterized protein n=1 Tax=Lithospermum erythrorhizon TaxID=34254 RepID=A0AAV3QBM5_LITER